MTIVTTQRVRPARVRAFYIMWDDPVTRIVLLVFVLGMIGIALTGCGGGGRCPNPLLIWECAT